MRRKPPASSQDDEKEFEEAFEKAIDLDRAKGMLTSDGQPRGTQFTKRQIDGMISKLNQYFTPGNVRHTYKYQREILSVAIRLVRENHEARENHKNNPEKYPNLPPEITRVELARHSEVRAIADRVITIAREPETDNSNRPYAKVLDENGIGIEQPVLTEKSIIDLLRAYRLGVAKVGPRKSLK